MAVKKHKIVDQSDQQIDLIALAQYVKIVLEQKSYSVKYLDTIKYCCNIITYLATYPLPTEEESVEAVAQHLQPFVTFFQCATTSFNSDEKAEFVTCLLEKFFAVISDTDCEASPVTSIVLKVFANDDESIVATSMWICQQETPELDAKLQASLSCLYRWLLEWPCTPYAAEWTLGFIKALEKTNHAHILIDVSLEHLEPLFELMVSTTSPVKNSAKVVLHILAAVRELPETLNKIANQVQNVLKWLAGDSRQWNRQILQDLVDILTSIMAEQVRLCDKDTKAIAKFREDYADVYLCLEAHMASSSSQILTNQCWRKSADITNSNTGETQAPLRKVGLVNLGNTCYLNSVMQALLLTRQFSNHTITHMSDLPYWSSMSQLFAQMNFSNYRIVDPVKFFNLMRPQNFASDQQQDSSEFLGHLLSLLEDYETSNESPEQGERPVSGTNRGIVAAGSNRPEKGDKSEDSLDVAAGQSNPLKRGNMAEAGPSRKRVVYKQSTYVHLTFGGPSNPLKRGNMAEAGPSRKRVANKQSTYVHLTFGGTMVTTIQCRDCQSKSISRDLFRILPLAVPEKLSANQNSVQNLLEFFCSSEELSGTNQYSCRVCGELKDADRSVSIESAPKHLVLILKNFRFDLKSKREIKLLHKIHCNDTVFLPMDGPRVVQCAYKIYAAVVHYGNTLHSGHYYTVAKDKNQWCVYDDVAVKPCGDNVLNTLTASRTPYILFYRRFDVEEPEELTLPDIPEIMQESIRAHNKNTQNQPRVTSRGNV